MCALKYPTYDHMSWNIGKERVFFEALSTGSSTAAAQRESLNGALWLLAVGQVRGALVLVAQTLEIAMKGFLRGLDPQLVLATGRRTLSDTDMASRLSAAKAAFSASRPRTVLVPAEAESEGDRTCTFLVAFDRVAKITGILEELRPEQTSSLRNSVVHEGGPDADALSCLSAVLIEAVPVLEEFYRRAHAIEIKDAISPALHRELVVASTYLNKADVSMPRRIANSALLPFRKVWFQYYQPSGFNPAPHAIEVDDGSKDAAVSEKVEHLRGTYRPVELLDGFDMNLQCVCCGDVNVLLALDTSEPFPQVEKKTGDCYFNVTHVVCPECDLELDPGHGELASIHFGPITQARIGDVAWAKLLRTTA